MAVGRRAPIIAAPALAVLLLLLLLLQLCLRPIECAPSFFRSDAHSTALFVPPATGDESTTSSEYAAWLSQQQQQQQQQQLLQQEYRRPTSRAERIKERVISVVHESIQPRLESAFESLNEHRSSLLLVLPERRHVLWSLPLIVGLLSFWTYPITSGAFHKLVQWGSGNTWIPDSDVEVSMQVNIVTQVVNGPVISSISILFATLASVTVSNLYQRQMDIKRAHAAEVQALRQLRLWMQQVEVGAHPTGSDMHANANSPRYHAHQHRRQYRHRHQHQRRQLDLRNVGTIGLELLDEYTTQLAHESRPTTSLAETMSLTTLRDCRSRHAGDLHLMALLRWCQDLYVRASSNQRERQELRDALMRQFSYARDQPLGPVRISEPSKALVAMSSSLPSVQVLQEMRALIAAMLEQRQRRWLALTTVFPLVHWITLAVLAVSIALSFLIASDHHEVLFQKSLPVRILWSLITSSITVLAVLCIDLSSPFHGAYQAFTGVN